MTVAELIEQLKKMPAEAPVGYIWDGGMRSHVDRVWFANNGFVVFMDNDGYVGYHQEAPANGFEICQCDECEWDRDAK